MKPVEPNSSKPSTDVRPELPDATREAAPQRLGGRAAYTFAPGTRVLAGYVIKRGLGQGGFGEVYYAVSDAGKDVALKLVRRNLEVELRGVMQCLNVKHPNLIGLYDVKVDDQENHWIVMEYVAGERLTDIIERHPHGLPPAEAIKILRGIGAGVGYLHDAGIVHRDLKPANIFVENGFIKIGDYGLSKFISSSRRSGQTESVGTVHYMAPEIANGRYGKQIDIYALGVLFCELLTGKLPFDGESVGEILMKHLTAEPELATVPEPYRTAIAGALKKDPEQRPRTVAAFLSAIDPTGDRRDAVGPEGPTTVDRAATAPNDAPRSARGSAPAAAARSLSGRLLNTEAPIVAAAWSLGILAFLSTLNLSRPALAFISVGLWTWFMVAVLRSRRRSNGGDSRLDPNGGKPSPRDVLRSAGPAYVLVYSVGFMAILGSAELQVAPLRLIVFGFWAWFMVALFRSIRRWLADRESRHRDAANLALRVTEEHLDAPAPNRIGRWMAVGAGMFGVALMVIFAVGNTKTIERRNPSVSTDVVSSSSSSRSVAESTDLSDPPLTALEAAAYNMRWGKIGLVSIVALGAVVGLAIAVGRRARAASLDGRPLHYAAMPVAQGPPTFRALAIDLTGSILLMFGASIVINRLLLLLLVDQLGVTTYLWSTATTFTAVALTALAIKTTRYLDRESSGRRLMFFAVGTAAGAASWAFAEYLGYAIPFDAGWRGMRMGIKITSWPECYVDGRPTVLAYMGYYGLSFLAIDWWNMTIAKRGSRWRIGDAFVAVFWAGAVHFVFPFPQPWGILTAAGTALVLPFAFPLPQKTRARTAQKELGGRYA